MIFMYFGFINDTDVKIFHHTVKSNFNALLTDILENNLFNVETIIENRLYRIIPLFYCDTIVSTNKNDKILDNRCVICEYDEDTILKFNTSDTVNDFDYNIRGRDVNDKHFYDFIFYDKVTLFRLDGVELIVNYYTRNRELVLSENYVSKNGVIIFEQNTDVEYYNFIFTFKFNDIVKTEM